MRTVDSSDAWDVFVSTHQGQVELAVTEVLASADDLKRVAVSFPSELAKHREKLLMANAVLKDVMEAINEQH